MTAQTLAIGSRGSKLALWQANHIAARLAGFGFETRVEIIKTTGDHLQTASLVQTGGKGLFTKEIEEALLDRRIDLAVHSLKDLPTESPEGLTIAGIPEREDPRDALLGYTLAALPYGARVGTSSERRAAQLLALRPDLTVSGIRGNVDTRLRKLKQGEFDAILLAAAGLNRLGFDTEIAQILSPGEMCPAPGQGALAVQTRQHDTVEHVCAKLNHVATARSVQCERALLAALGGGCQLPVGAFATVEGDQLHLMAVVISRDGKQVFRDRISGPADQAIRLGENLAASLLHRGAGRILQVSPVLKP
jgi:hydroxymethylbilane synthase